jgi:hypothetical protein
VDALGNFIDKTIGRRKEKKKGERGEVANKRPPHR